MSESTWPEFKLGDLIQVKHGFAFKSEYFKPAGTHILLTPGNFHEGGGFKDRGDATKWYDGPVPSDYVLAEGDLIVAMTEQAEGLLGSSALVPQGGKFLHNQRLGRVQVLDESEVDRRFIYYLFNTATVRQQIRASATGAKIRHTAPARIGDVKVRIPRIDVQRRIAGLLATYDEFIENIERRVQVLDEMTRLLYREWFIESRFPCAGCDQTRGWERTTVGKRFETVLGGTPSRARPEFWNEGTVPWINSGAVNHLRITQPSEFITELALQRSAAKLMPIGTTVLAITGATLGQVSFLEIETAANQSVVGVIDRSGEYSEWIYLTIRARIAEIVAHASGGAQQHINKDIVRSIELVVPPKRLALAFKELVEPMFHHIAVLLFQTESLRRTRDLLLPRLMSGQLTLPD